MSAPSEDRPELGAEDLVAYLDHEVDTATSEQLERRLAEDAALRKELTRFEHVWEALDQLPRGAVRDDFTHKTVEMVAEAAENDLKTTGPNRIVRRRGWLWRLGLLLLTVLVGFIVVRARWPNPNRELIEALPIIERLDEYRAAGNIEYLRELDKLGVFSDEAAAIEAETPPKPEGTPAPESAP